MSVGTHVKRPRSKKITRVILLLLASLMMLLVVILAAVPLVVMPQILGQRIEQEQFSSQDYGISSQRVTLTTDDALSLAAWRTRAEGDAKGTVILLSGIENPSVTAFFGYAAMLSRNGWDALLIEMRARSESEGDEIGLGMTEWLDVKAGVEFLSADAERQNLPIVAMGTSMGGATVIIAAGQLPQIDAVISISAFSSWSSMFVEYMAMLGVPKVLAVLDIPFVNLYIGLHFGFDALAYSPIRGITKLDDRPILMMHATADSQVPFSEFERLLDRANAHGANVTTFIRPGDHHFVCQGAYLDTPQLDKEFSGAVLDFLAAAFP